jgi:hypothetical protein
VTREAPAALLSSLPRAARRSFARLYPQAPATLEHLRNRLSRQTADVDSAAAGRSGVDVALSEAITERLERLLGEWDQLDEEQRAVVHAAVEYYVLDDDGEADLDSELGFEDDAAVVNACVRWLGRAELVIRDR